MAAVFEGDELDSFVVTLDPGHRTTNRDSKTNGRLCQALARGLNEQPEFVLTANPNHAFSHPVAKQRGGHHEPPNVRAAQEKGPVVSDEPFRYARC